LILSALICRPPLPQMNIVAMPGGSPPPVWQNPAMLEPLPEPVQDKDLVPECPLRADRRDIGDE
jgi:hypothetical protein